MIFNPHPLKQAQETIFSGKINQINHYPLFFNHNLVNSTYNLMLQFHNKAKTGWSFYVNFITLYLKYP